MWTISAEHKALKYICNYFGFYCLYYMLMSNEIYFWHMIYMINVKLLLLNEYLELDEEGIQVFRTNNLEIQLNNLKVQESSSKATPKTKKISFKRRFAKNGAFFNDGKFV